MVLDSAIYVPLPIRGIKSNRGCEIVDAVLELMKSTIRKSAVSVCIGKLRISQYSQGKVLDCLFPLLQQEVVLTATQIRIWICRIEPYRAGAVIDGALILPKLRECVSATNVSIRVRGIKTNDFGQIVNSVIVGFKVQKGLGAIEVCIDVVRVPLDRSSEAADCLFQSTPPWIDYFRSLRRLRDWSARCALLPDQTR